MRLVALLVLLLASDVQAEVPDQASGGSGGPEARVQLNGSLRLGYWTSSRDLDDRDSILAPRLWIRVRARLSDRLSLVTDGWLGSQEIGKKSSLHGRLREGYLSLNLGSLDLRLGKQIVPWGKADGINPTDSLSARDFTLLVAEDDDQRDGLTMLRAALHRSSISLTGIWIVDSESDTVPAGSPPPMFHFEVREPRRNLHQGAAKLEGTGRVDWSVSYFDGLHHFPDLGLERGQLPIPLVWSNHREKVMGIDLATPVRRWAVRGEAAYHLTEDRAGTDPWVRNPFFFAVAGAEGALGEFTAGAQYVLRAVRLFQDPARISDPLDRAVALQAAAVEDQIQRVQHGTTLRLSRRLRHDTLELEGLGVAFFPRAGFFFRAKGGYALTDRWKATLGADLFRGGAETFLGHLRENSAAHVELKYAF